MPPVRSALERIDFMKALVTGASSGIGREIAVILDGMGYDIIAVARRRDRLDALAERLQNNTTVYTADLSREEECEKLFETFPDIDVLINNAGFGVFGEFVKTDLQKELSMLDVNIRALHILTKLYLNRFEAGQGGYILNVASSAAFFPGPMLSSYYASKAYVYRLTRAIRRELRRHGGKSSVSLLCPGPVDTEFSARAGVNFGIGALSAKRVAAAAVSGLFQKKSVIVPGFFIKCSRFLSKITPDCIAERIVYRIQKAKEKN